MVIITNELHIVVSVNLIRGLAELPNGYHCYETYDEISKLPTEGEIYNPFPTDNIVSGISTDAKPIYNFIVSSEKYKELLTIAADGKLYFKGNDVTFDELIRILESAKFEPK